MKYSIGLIWILLIVSCSNKAIDFNNQLVSSERTIKNGYDRFMERVEEDSAEIVYALADSLQKATEKEIEIVKKLSVPKDGDSLKFALMREFEFVINMYKNIKLEKGVNSTKEERLAARTWIMDSQVLSDSFYNASKQAQEKYMKLNKIKVGTEQ